MIELFNQSCERLYFLPPFKDAELRQSLPPRLRKVLDRLLAGDSEKEAAKTLGLSVHSVHQYAKLLYRRLDVCSRSELMARFVDR